MRLLAPYSHLTQYCTAPQRGTHRLSQFIFSYFQDIRFVQLPWDNIYTYSSGIKCNKLQSSDTLHYNSILITELLIPSSPSSLLFSRLLNTTTNYKQPFLSPKIYPKLFRSKVKNSTIQFQFQWHPRLTTLQY